MQRCVPHALLLAAGVSLALSAPYVAHAQTHRQFSPQTLRGEFQLVQTPDVLLNGQPARLSPGTRVYGPNNLLQQPASLAGQKLTVHYTVAPDGQVLDVWVLNPVELANKTWPRTPLEAASWAFEPGTQTWLKR
ncbi:MAG: hypothetical protein CFE41_08625 [Burkholderiales bacterium PBB2]|nr:MAG: hypothetical protein CFE41_08625 [Burkholderiales bacterium PBB2]